MQLCAGSVRSKNTLNILIKNVIDGCTGALAFYFVGYGLAYGAAEDGSGNPFIGSNDFFLTQTSQSGTWHLWLFQWAFAAATATIVSGSVAERCSFEAYVAYSFYLSAFVYPTVAHWCVPRPSCLPWLLCTFCSGGAQCPSVTPEFSMRACVEDEGRPFCVLLLGEGRPFCVLLCVKAWWWYISE